MIRKKSKRQIKDEKEELLQVYFKSLDALVDRLFQIAFDKKYTWAEMASISGIGAATISKLGNRETRFPQYRTVELLAHALGGKIDWAKGTNRKAIVIKWKPEQFASKYRKKQKLKIA